MKTHLPLFIDVRGRKVVIFGGGAVGKRKGALVNRVDKVSEVIVPSVINRGSITIAISTDAMSPALSRYMRERVEEIITPEFGTMAKLQNEMREILKKEITNQHERKRILFDILDDETIWLALRESYEKAQTLSMSYIR